MKKTEVTHVNKPHDVYIGRPSLFGNCFPITDTEGRSVVIARYREYFLQRVESDPAFRRAALQLQGKRLGCYCHPLRCHGEVIAKWVDEQYEKITNETAS